MLLCGDSSLYTLPALVQSPGMPTAQWSRVGMSSLPALSPRQGSMDLHVIEVDGVASRCESLDPRPHGALYRAGGE